MEIKITCPLGSECEVAKEGIIERCAWYVQMRGTDATGQDSDRWDCAITWQPILQVEVAGANRSVASAMESMRNEQTKRQDSAIQTLQSIEESQHASIESK